MHEYRIDGTASALAITEAIRDIEVSRARFTGATIDGTGNLLQFTVERVPPKPTLLAADQPAPADSQVAWSGRLLVGGKQVDVRLYRHKAVATDAGGDLEMRVRLVQDALGVAVDGKAGPETWAALAQALTADAPAAPAVAAERANIRSEKIIATLSQSVRPYARALFFKAKANGISINIISGTRTFAEQNALYARGRTTPGAIVTKARGGYSNHNFGIAFDVGVFEGAAYLGESPKYAAVGVLGRELGLEWGGDWTSFVDAPHFQLRPDWAAGLSGSRMLAALRERYPDGTGIA